MFRVPKNKHNRERGNPKFFLIALSHDSLMNYYQTNFAMVQHHNYSLQELEDMIPWERDIYVALLRQFLEEEEQRAREEEAKNG